MFFRIWTELLRVRKLRRRPSKFNTFNRLMLKKLVPFYIKVDVSLILWNALAYSNEVGLKVWFFGLFQSFMNDHVKECPDRSYVSCIRAEAKFAHHRSKPGVNPIKTQNAVLLQKKGSRANHNKLCFFLISDSRS